MRHQESFVVVGDVLEESFEPDDIFADDLLLGLFKAFAARKKQPVVVADLEIVLVVVDLYPVPDDLVEIGLEGSDDAGYLLLIIVVDIQDVLDVEPDKELRIDAAVLLVRLVLQIGEVDQESEERFPDGGEDAEDDQIRIIFFEDDLIVGYRSGESLADPEIQVVDILFDMIDILFGELFFERLQKLLMLQVPGDILIDGFDELAVRDLHHPGDLLSYESFEELDDLLVLDVEPDILGVDVLQDSREEGLVERLEQADIGVDVLDVGLVRQEESLFPGSDVLCGMLVEKDVFAVLVEESSVVEERVILFIELIVDSAHLLDDGFPE